MDFQRELVNTRFIFKCSGAHKIQNEPTTNCIAVRPIIPIRVANCLVQSFENLMVPNKMSSPGRLPGSTTSAGWSANGSSANSSSTFSGKAWSANHQACCDHSSWRCFLSKPFSTRCSRKVCWDSVVSGVKSWDPWASWSQPHHSLSMSLTAAQNVSSSHSANHQESSSSVLWGVYQLDQFWPEGSSHHEKSFSFRAGSTWV